MRPSKMARKLGRKIAKKIIKKVAHKLDQKVVLTSRRRSFELHPKLTHRWSCST